MISSVTQYGFREKRSTEHSVLEITNQIQTKMERKLYTCGIFLDLQKAFDTVEEFRKTQWVLTMNKGSEFTEYL